MFRTRSFVSTILAALVTTCWITGPAQAEPVAPGESASSTAAASDAPTSTSAGGDPQSDQGGRDAAAAAGDVGPTSSWRDDWKKWYCASNASPDQLLQSYPLKTGTLPVKGDPGVTIKQINTYAEFKCGHSGFGYFHILARHYSQWQDLANFTGSGRNWLDGLNYGLRLAFQNPGTWSYQRSNDTSCYSSKVQTATNGRGGTRQWYANAVVAGNKRVITAYPSSKPAC